jgi:choline monooxygenase
MFQANLIEHLKSKGLDKAYTLPAEFYTDSIYLDLEYTSIFENTWQLVGHESQLRNPGDQIVAQVGKIPLVVVRTEKQELKAFHNVCRHRAGPVAVSNCNTRSLRCKYHGWTYTLDGDLRSAPEMDSTPDFDVCQYHLPRVQLTTWQGFVFVSTNKNNSDIEDIFIGIKENILPIDLTQMQYHHRDEYVINCNWKVYVDNYLEGYHLPHVHPGLNKLLDYRSYTTAITEWYSYQHSPLESLDENFYGDGDAHYYCIFPNLMLNILPNRVQTNVIQPLSANKTKVIFDYYYKDMESEQTQKMIAEDQEFSDQVQKEDVDICEQVQVGLNSGSYIAGRLCMKRESGVLHFQNLIRNSLRKAISEQISRQQENV